MSDHVTLTLRTSIVAPLETDCIAADRFATLGESEIARLPVWSGRETHAIGDWFDVRGGRSSRLRVVGNVRHVAGIGGGMSGGELIIDGDAGARTGAAMTGGSIEVRGSAGDDAGVAMTGGALHVHGDAGDRVGGAVPGAARGMSGGEIFVGGSVGRDACGRVRRGLLCIAGNAADRAARDAIAGTVIVLGDVGSEPATGSKRGTLVVGGKIDVPVTYRYACTFVPPHVRVVLTHVARRFGVTIDPRFSDQPYRRFCGDAATVGRGEILWLT